MDALSKLARKRPASGSGSGNRLTDIGRLAAIYSLNRGTRCVRIVFTRTLFVCLLLPIGAIGSENPRAGRDIALPAVPVLTSVIERLRSDRNAPLIIQLDVATQPEGKLASPGAVAAQRIAIKRVQDRVLANLTPYQLKQAKRFKYLPYVAVTLDEAGVRAALADPDIKAVHEDRLSVPTLAQSTPLIGADTGWSEGYSGNGQTIAILDTGVDGNHSFLSGKVVHEACYSSTSAFYNSTSVCPNGAETQVGVGAGAPCAISNACNHGTHVAGIAAGKGTASSGVARDAAVMAIQVFTRFDGQMCTQTGQSSPCVLSFTSDQIGALEHVYGQRGNFDVAAVNMSLGGGRFTSACDGDPSKAAVDLLRSVGVATVVAAGNEGYTDAISAPACISSAVSTGSTTKSDGVSYFSNSAQLVDLLAPGSSIYSSVPGGGFASFSGTSMATPHVAGAFAVMRSKTPSATVDEILSVLKSTGTTVTDSRNGIAKPRIQIDSALEAIADGSTAGLLSVTPADGMLASGLAGGPFSPATKSYTLTNDDSSQAIAFEVLENVGWASVTPDNGSLAPGDSTQVTVSIAPAAASLTAGNYASSIEFVNTTNGRGTSSRSLTLSVAVSGTANDKFEDALPLGDSSGSTTGSNVGATKESGEPNHAGVIGGRSVWWRWTASAAGTAHIDTVGSTFDTLLAAYTGSSVASLNSVAGNDDAVGLQSRITFATQAGVTYYVVVDGYSGASGDINLNWDFEPGTTPPESISVTPATAFNAAGPEGGSFTPESIIYTLTNVSSNQQPFQVQNLPAWLSASQIGGSLAPNQSTTVALTLNAAATALEPGVYATAVLFNTVSRAVTLDVASVAAPSNDDFGNAGVLGTVPVSATGSNVEASKETGEPDHGDNGGGRSVWWRWTASSPAIVTVDTFGSNFDTTLGVYTGGQVENLTTIAANDDAGDGLQSRISFVSQAGTTYYIAVDGYDGESGSVGLNLTLQTGGAPAHDRFAAAITLNGSAISTTGSNVGASKETGEPSHGGNIGGRSVWWRWRAPSSNVVTIDTFGSNFDTTLGVYTGVQVNSLGTIASNDDAADLLQSQVAFAAEANTTYYIAVDGFNGEAGNIALSVTLGGNASDTEAFQYFPLHSGNQWTYSHVEGGGATEISTVLEGTFTVNGVPTVAVQSDSGNIRYYTNDSQGLRLHRIDVYDPDFDVTDPVTFIPPMRLAGTTLTVGETVTTNGTATFELVGIGVFPLNYSSTSEIEGLESVTVPLGSFDTVRAKRTFNLSGTIGGEPFDETEVDTYWLAKYIGPVRETYTFDGATDTYELTAVSIDTDDDGVNVTEDNCPVDANPGQTNTDSDNQGDACDIDDDNDGVADADDAFPLDAGESVDTDGDGTGNNADLDDDGDSLPDKFETATENLDPLDGTDANLDNDADELTNLQEYQLGTGVNNPDSDGDGTKDGPEVAAGRNPLLNEPGVLTIINSILLD